MSCFPAPKITWYKGSTALSEGGRYTMINKVDGANYTLQMEISNVSAEDGGGYKVNVKNDQGEGNADLTLNLEGMV